MKINLFQIKMKETKYYLIMLFITLNLIFQVYGLKLERKKANNINTNDNDETYVKFFSLSDYKGDQNYAKEGDYDLKIYGKEYYSKDGYFKDNDISSVIVGPKTDLYIYEEEQFLGKCKKIHNGNSIYKYSHDLVNIGMDNMISSYKVRKANIDEKKEIKECELEYLTPYVEIYSLSDLKGEHSYAKEGDYNFNPYGKGKSYKNGGYFKNDDISSVKLGPKTILYLYTEESFLGICKMIYNGNSLNEYSIDLAKIGINDKISSYKVKKGNNNNGNQEIKDCEVDSKILNNLSTYAFLYQDDYMGDSFTRTDHIGDYNLENYGKSRFREHDGYFVDDDISSVLVGHLTDLYLYEDDNFKGLCILIHNGKIQGDYFVNLNDHKFSNIASSYKLRKAKYDLKQEVSYCDSFNGKSFAQLYFNKNNEGSHTTALEGDYDLDPYGKKEGYSAGGYFYNDETSSVLLGPKTDLFIYSNDKFTGYCKQIHNGKSQEIYFLNLDTIGFNKMISSYKVKPANVDEKQELINCDPFNGKPFAELYHNYNKKGAHTTGSEGDYDYKPYCNWEDYADGGYFKDDDIRSVNVGRKTDLYIYSEKNFSGKCKIIHNGMNNEDYFINLNIIEFADMITSYKVKSANADGKQEVRNCS